MISFAVMAAKQFIKGGYKTVGADGIRVDEDGKRLSFELIYTAPFHTERLSLLKEEAKKCGLEIMLNNMTDGGFTLLVDKKHEAFFVFYTRNSFDLIQGHKRLIPLYSSINKH